MEHGRVNVLASIIAVLVLAGVIAALVIGRGKGESPGNEGGQGAAGNVSEAGRSRQPSAVESESPAAVPGNDDMSENRETLVEGPPAPSRGVGNPTTSSISVVDRSFATTTGLETVSEANDASTLTGIAVLAGRAYLESTGTALSDVTIRIYRYAQPGDPRGVHYERTMRTDETGAFRFEGLPEGTYRIRASKPPLLPSPRKEHKPPETITLQTGEQRLDADFFLFRGFTVRGKVTRKDTGEPLEGAVVSPAFPFLPTKQSSPTGPDGVYVLEGLQSSRIDLTARKKGFSLSVPANGLPAISVVFDPDKPEVTQDLQMDPAILISGTVKTESGSPVFHAKVRALKPGVINRDIVTWSDREGRYSIEAMPFTTVRIRAEAAGFPIALSDPVEVRDTAVDGVDIVVNSGTKVSGSVVDPNGKPVPAAEIAVILSVRFGSSWFADQIATRMADGAGQFELENLPTGQISLIAKKEGYSASPEKRLTLHPGDHPDDVVLHLTSSHYLAGRVTDADGAPVAEAHLFVYAHGMTLSRGSATTDDEGRYRVEGLSNITHNVRITRDHTESVTFRNVKVDRDDADFVLGVPNGATLIGRVVDATSGAPVKEFTVGGPGISSVRVVRDPSSPGRFRMTGLEPGMSYQVSISAPGYAIFRSLVSVPKGETRAERDFPMGPGGTISGRVVRRGTGNPLAGVRVLLRGTGNEYDVQTREPEVVVNTTSDGRFQFLHVGAGINRVEFVPEKPLVKMTKEVGVNHGRATGMGDVELSGGGIIRGRVVRSPGDGGVGGLTIEITTPNYPTPVGKPVVTDSTGTFEFAGISEGKYFVSVREQRLRVSVELGPDETKEVQVRIGSAKLQGRTLQGGKPVSVYIHLSWEGYRVQKWAQSDSDGHYAFTGLEPGTYTASTYLGDVKNSVREEVTLSAGQTLDHDFVFPEEAASGDSGAAR